MRATVESGIADAAPLLQFNFNSERIGSISHAIFSTRVAYDEALRYAHKRKTFGKFLVEHPVIRAKLANSGFWVWGGAREGGTDPGRTVARQIEAAHAWLELVVYQVRAAAGSRVSTAS